MTAIGRRQLELPLEAPTGVRRVGTIPSREEVATFRLRLEQRLGAGAIADLRLTENRSTILTAQAVAASESPMPDGRSRSAAIALRIHRSFVHAPGSVLDAVAAYASSGARRAKRRRALETIRGYFEECTVSEPATELDSAAIEPHGETYDLEEIRDRLVERYFDGRLEVAITWGRRLPRRRTRRKQRSIQLGSYVAEENLIRLHRALDDPAVPRLVVESVVYHELLHAVIPAPRRNGRRRLHPPEFRRRELELEGIAEAEAWIDRHLFALLERRDRERSRRR